MALALSAVAGICAGRFFPKVGGPRTYGWPGLAARKPRVRVQPVEVTTWRRQRERGWPVQKIAAQAARGESVVRNHLRLGAIFG